MSQALLFIPTRSSSLHRRSPVLPTKHSRSSNPAQPLHLDPYTIFIPVCSRHTPTNPSSDTADQTHHHNPPLPNQNGLHQLQTRLLRPKRPKTHAKRWISTTQCLHTQRLPTKWLSSPTTATHPTRQDQETERRQSRLQLGSFEHSCWVAVPWHAMPRICVH